MYYYDISMKEGTSMYLPGDEIIGEFENYAEEVNVYGATLDYDLYPDATYDSYHIYGNQIYEIQPVDDQSGTMPLSAYEHQPTVLVPECNFDDSKRKEKGCGPGHRYPIYDSPFTRRQQAPVLAEA